MQISAYENLKSSGSAWLGDIPTHWGTKKLKFLATIQPSNVDKKTVEGEEPVILCNYTDVYKNEYIDGRLEFMQASATEAEIKKFKVDIGDVIVTKDSETPDDIAVPACIAEEVEGLVCGYHLTQIKPINLHGPYLFRLFQSKGFNAQFVVSANGVTRFGLPQHAIANAFTPLPPLEEQQTIARFLDFKTAQIDALIAKQKTLLDKLAEKRTALISHAVTKGLDSSVAMKDSGVAWLGRIPAHWIVSKLTYLSDSLQTGPFGSQLHAEEYIEGGVPLINPTDISNGKILENAKITVGDNVVERLSRHKLELGDIVIARRGEMGRAGLVRAHNVGWLCGTGSLRARLNKKALNPEFLLYQFSMRGVAEYLSLQSVGSTMDNLNTSILGRLPVIAPPLNEQSDLVVHLRKLSESIDSQVEKVGQVIFSLQEYRSALITNAVTGKIDVRDFQIPPPAEVQETL